MPILINPFADFVLGGVVGLCVYFTATDSWWTLPHLIRRLF